MVYSVLTLSDILPSLISSMFFNMAYPCKGPEARLNKMKNEGSLIGAGEMSFGIVYFQSMIYH